MVRESSNRSDGPCAEQYKAFIEVEAGGEPSQVQHREPALSVLLGQGLELRVNNRVGVDLAACFIERLENPATSHRIRLECSLDQEGGGR